ncbi:hypothetical protein B0H14DRAFT_2557031 [Mycena olivaceomarginata]|nr:hypothetical protein B0H14DRAFT_2557031 [Mycena olivaceomarginata]
METFNEPGKGKCTARKTSGLRGGRPSWTWDGYTEARCAPLATQRALFGCPFRHQRAFIIVGKTLKLARQNYRDRVHVAQSRYPPGGVHDASHTRQVDAMNGHEDQQGNVYDELKMLGTSNCARLVPANLSIRYNGDFLWGLPLPAIPSAESTTSLQGCEDAVNQSNGGERSQLGPDAKRRVWADVAQDQDFVASRRSRGAEGQTAEVEITARSA